MILLTQFSCAVCAIGLLAIAFDLDKKSSPVVRRGLTAVSVVLVATCLAIRHNPALYEHTTAISLTVLAIMGFAFFCYLALTKQIHATVVRIAGGAVVFAVLMWVFLSCSDSSQPKNPACREPVPRDSVHTSAGLQETADQSIWDHLTNY